MRRLIALMAGLTLGVSAVPALAKDYLVTVTKPNKLYVVDAAARSVANECTLDFNLIPGVIAMSPDGTIAYILANRWEDVFGIDLETCETVFSAKQSSPDVRRKTVASLAVSKDGKEVYTIRNPVKLLPDRYEIMEPEFAVYDTSAGLDAQPVKTFPAPRRMTVMASGDNGMVYAAGHEIYQIDPESEEISVKIPNKSWDRPTYSGPDVLAFWPIGSQADEFLLLYSAAKFTDPSQQELADFVWGYETVDLSTGDSAIEDFASFEVIMFSAARNPQNKDELFGVYTQLSKHNVATKELIKRVDLPHTYYVVNVSSDGKEVYVGGTNSDIGVYDSETLERIGEIDLPSGGDMAAATLQVIQRGS